MRIPLEEAKRHATEAYPKECGGVFVRTESEIIYCPAKHVSKVDDHFAITPYEWLELEQRGEIHSFFHSHVNWPPIPGKVDVAAINGWGRPWIIMSMPSGEWAWHEPSGLATAPLLGRTFEHEKTDCYELIRDAYARLGVLLPAIPRKDHWWKTPGQKSLYREHFEEAGFFEVKEMQLHDLIVMQMDSQVENHAGIYVGDNMFLHQLPNRLSYRAIYGDFYRKHTNFFLRHRSLC